MNRPPKAAILTFCNNNGPTNYGQILQCCAVQRFLTAMGYEAGVVLYQKNAANEVVTDRKRRFDSFIQRHIQTTRPCFTIRDVETVTDGCDVLICGSDQVWHPNYVDRIWALDFGRAEQKRIAVAASGVFHENEKTIPALKELGRALDRFDVVSVRESRAKEILSRYTNKPIHALADPTLLLPGEEWDALASESAAREPYILCYCLGFAQNHALLIQEAARLYGNIPVRLIPSNLFNESLSGFFCPELGVGPAEFLSLVRNARAVITDSFHGVAFSLIYGVDCYPVRRQERGEDQFGGPIRIASLAPYLTKPVFPSACVKDIRRGYEAWRSGQGASLNREAALAAYAVIRGALTDS